MKTKNNSRNVLVTLADKNYVVQAKQLFSSAYWNGKWKGNYLLLANNISKKDLKWFRKKGIIIYKCKSLWNKKKYGALSSTTLIKFYLFKTYFKRWKKTLFIDGDAIVIRPLNGLMKYKGVSAAHDFLGTSLRENFRKGTTNHDIGGEYSLNSRAFNSGVLVIENNIIKKQSFVHLKKMIGKYSSIALWGEQPILNLYFYKKWNLIPLKYNFLTNLYSNKYNVKVNFGVKIKGKDDPREKVVIIHFAGSDVNHKPWSKANMYYNRWKKNLKISEDIDLKHIPKKSGNNIDEKKDFSTIIYYNYFNAKIFVHDTYHFVRMIIGKIIKKMSPDLYYKLGGKY